MAAASLDVNFKEELSAIEQCESSATSVCDVAAGAPRHCDAVADRVHDVLGWSVHQRNSLAPQSLTLDGDELEGFTRYCHPLDTELTYHLQGSRSFQRPSAQPLFTVFCNILRRFRFASSSRSFSRWPGPTP